MKEGEMPDYCVNIRFGRLSASIHSFGPFTRINNFKFPACFISILVNPLYLAKGL